MADVYSFRFDPLRVMTDGVIDANGEQIARVADQREALSLVDKLNAAPAPALNEAIDELLLQITALIEYRNKAGALGFQLEKADHFFARVATQAAHVRTLRKDGAA